ncbi:hexitol phosphatase HxpB [bacterium]|nr:hexitol phosphatase HxpB [bacterium]
MRQAETRLRLQAVIFDMDGLLIDSEPFWRDAEVAVLNPLGVPINHEDCAQFAGLRIREVVANWRELYPWDGESTESVADRIQQQLCDSIRERGQLLPGAQELVQELHYRGYPLAIATSSAPDVVDAVMDVSGLREAFTVIASASDEQYGKPHPAVYLSAAARLGIEPQHCLVFEDALLGIIAAKAARMTVVAVPEELNRGDVRFQLADRVIESLRDFWEDAGDLLG